MKNPWEPERLTPRSRIHGPGSFSFWYASAERSISPGRIPFEPGLHENLSWVIPGCHQINVGRRLTWADKLESAEARGDV